MPPKAQKTRKAPRRKEPTIIGPKELLEALDVQQTTISAAHMRVGQQLKQLQLEEHLLEQMLQRARAAEAAAAGDAAHAEPTELEFEDA